MHDRRSRIAASIVALVAAVSLWLSLGTIAVISGDTHRIAALPSIWILVLVAIGAPVVAWIAKLRFDLASPLLITLLLWLPFLPGHVPAAFLIWEGPSEAFVWLLAVAGVIASRPRRVPAALASPDRAPWIAGAIVAIAALAVFTQVRGVVPGGDEPHYLAATQSLLGDFDLKVANNYANGDYLDYFPGRLEPHFLKRSTSGEIYSIHAPGVSIAVLPAFALAGYGGAVVTMILIAALTAMITWHLAWRVSGSVAGAWAGVAAVFATTPYFFHTFTIYPEIVGSLCVAIGAWLLVDLADGREVSSRRLIATGAALALLPWLHSRFALIAAALGIVIVARLAGSRSAPGAVARFLAVPVIAGAAWFAFFWLIWGSPSPTAPYGEDTSTSAAYILRGLIGLLVDQQFGLVTTAPIYLLAIVGVIVLTRVRPRLTLELALVVVPYAVAVASYEMWWAGSAAPARFLVAVLPLAAVPVATAFTRASIFTAIVLILSIGATVPRAVVEGGRFIYNSRGALDATLEWLSQTVDLTAALPSVHRDGGAIAIRDASVWLVVFAGVYFLAATLAKRPASVRWTAASLALIIGAMFGTSVLLELHRADATVNRSQIAAFAAFRPAWQRVTFEIPGYRPVTQADFLARLSFQVPNRARRIDRLPPGEYRLAVNPEWRGPIAMFVGRNDPPIETPQADDLRDNRSGFRLRLPVALQSLNVRPASDSVEQARWLELTPVAVGTAATRRNAVRANRYGRSRAFFFDDWAYPERDGFWTRANGSATVVIDTDSATRQSGLPIAVTAGAVPTTIRLSIGDWAESFDLAAGQKQEVMLPPAVFGTWALAIRSGAGFRPSEREPGNRDVRMLAAWIAIQ